MKRPVCQGFCVIIASPEKQAVVKYFNNSDCQLLNSEEGFSQKMGCGIHTQAPLHPRGFVWLIGSLTNEHGFIGPRTQVRRREDIGAVSAFRR